MALSCFSVHNSYAILRACSQNFKHYRDLWRLDTESWSWESLPARGGPSARSGHRMALYKASIIMFGGFYGATEGCRCFVRTMDALFGTA